MKRLQILAAVSFGIATAIHAVEEYSFLQSSSPEEWEQAIQLTTSRSHANAIRLFERIEKNENKNPNAIATELARYYILYNFTELGRFSDIADRHNQLDINRLPLPFRADANRLITTALLESGAFEKTLDSIQSSLMGGVGGEGRLRLLQGRAQAHLGMTSEAIDTITSGLLYGGDIPIGEKRKAVMVLLQILEHQGRLAEVEQLDRIFGYIWSERK